MNKERIRRKSKKSCCGWCKKEFFASNIASARRKVFKHIEKEHQDKEIGLLKKEKER